MPFRRSLFALLCVLSLSVPASAAAPLVDRVPGDALAYLGWTGSDACPGYDASHLKSVIGTSSIPQVFTSFVPQIVRRVGRLDGHAGEILDRLVAVGSPAWHHPTAFYLGGVDYAGPHPMPRLALLCDAGADAGSLSDQLNQLIAELPPDADPRPTVRTYGNLVVLSLQSPDKTDALFAQPGGRALGTNAKFTAALAQCRPTGAALVGYLDVQGVVKALDEGVQRSNDKDAVAQWPKIRASLGLGGFRQVALTSGFDGKDWVDRTFASTDGGHTGLLSMLDARPLDGDLLGVVPRTADRVAASRFDLAAGFDAIHDGIATFSPDAAAKVDQTLGQVNDQAGINVRRDLIGSLGDQWVTYSDRSIGGSSVLGSVLANRLRDPVRADQSMTQLSRRLNTIVARQLGNPMVSIQFRDEKVNGTTLHYLAVPLVTPTWAVKGGYLYVGLYPQVVAAAVDSVDHKSPSILTRPEFAATMKRLGDHPAASLSFTNLPGVAPDGYTDLLSTTRLFLGLGDIFGAQAPMFVVPPLRQVMVELAPSGSVSWADATGWHSTAVSPFPGAEILSAGNTGGGGMMQLPMFLGAIGGMREQLGR